MGLPISSTAILAGVIRLVIKSAYMVVHPTNFWSSKSFFGRPGNYGFTTEIYSAEYRHFCYTEPIKHGLTGYVIPGEPPATAN